MRDRGREAARFTNTAGSHGAWSQEPFLDHGVNTYAFLFTFISVGVLSVPTTTHAKYHLGSKWCPSLRYFLIFQSGPGRLWGGLPLMAETCYHSAFSWHIKMTEKKAECITFSFHPRWFQHTYQKLSQSSEMLLCTKSTFLFSKHSLPFTRDIKLQFLSLA